MVSTQYRYSREERTQIESRSLDIGCVDQGAGCAPTPTPTGRYKNSTSIASLPDALEWLFRMLLNLCC